MDDGSRRLRAFLTEDVGRGDVSSAILPRRRIRARIITREPCVVAGTAYARRMFAMGGCTARIITRDGTAARKNQRILEISGTPQQVLPRERTALNLLARMSGIATQTRAVVKSIPGTVGLYATRKTAPGLRIFDKEAVEIGGGVRHRMSLHESVLLKDNHIAVAGSIPNIIRDAKKKHGRIEIEVETQKDAVLAAQCGADTILLDNFAPGGISRTVSELKRLGLRDRVVLEASGGITANTAGRFARTGVDMISMGSLTSSVRGIDFSLDVY